MRGSARIGPGDGQQLALPLAEIMPLLGHLRLVTLRQVADKPVGIGQLCRRAHLFVAGLQTAVANIFHHRARKEEGVLQDDAQLGADRVLLSPGECPARRW